MSAQGFFHCDHCHRVVEMPESLVDAALQSPSGQLVDLQCPQCRHHAVRWRGPARERKPAVQVRREPKVLPPVSQERAQELFADLHKAWQRPD